MPFSNLYDAVQTLDNRISTKWLRERAIEFSEITKVKEQWSGIIDGTILRGFYIEGPMGPPIILQEKEALIVLSRSMCTGPRGEHWRRFIYAKELMHVFDDPEERTDSKEKFDLQVDRLSDPSAPMSAQFRAETKAFWRAMAVLCTDKRRAEFNNTYTNFSAMNPNGLCPI